MSADRNLLFGILALQLNFVSRDQLVEGMHAWVLNKAKSLGQIFIASNAMDADQFRLLDALVHKHIEKHGGNIHQSIQQLSSVDPHATQILKGINDSDLHMTLGLVSAQTTDSSTTQPFQQAPKRSCSRFRIIRPHARGGLGEVFLAQDTELSREVALKEIQGPYADNTDSRERFLREAEITGRLEHPGIVPVYGLGTYDDGRPFYAMKFIKGDSLKEAIDKFHAAPETKAAKSFLTGNVGIRFRELLGRFIDVCNAVHYAHSRGVLHRDLKPGNIMIGEYGETIVVDWGVAKVVGERVVENSDKSLLQPSGDGSAPTVHGTVVGTPAFMSPEQAAGDLDKLGPATDVYSLGATLYYLLTGVTPYHECQSFEELIRAIQGKEVPRPTRRISTIEATLESICLKSLSRNPQDRYLTADDLQRDLRFWLSDEPVLGVSELAMKKIGRFLRRHPKFVAGLCTLVICSCGASIGAVQLQKREKQQRDKVLNAVCQIVFKPGREKDGKRFLLSAAEHPESTWAERTEDIFDEKTQTMIQRQVLYLRLEKQVELADLLSPQIPLNEAVDQLNHSELLNTDTFVIAPPRLIGD